MQSLIYIPTFRRDRVYTYEALPLSLQARTLLVVDREDAARLTEQYGSIHVARCPMQGKGLDKVRQWIVEDAERSGQPLAILIDDDLRFQNGYWEDERKKFRAATPKEIERGFRKLEEKAAQEGVGFTSFSTPFFNDSAETWKLKRMAYSFFINLRTRQKTRASFRGVPAMSDVKFSLETYTKGFPSYSHMNFAAVDRSKSATGGTAGLRRSRADAHEAAAKWLAEKYPRYIRLVDQSTNGRHMDNIGTAVDIRFAALRAYRDNAA